MPHFGQRFDHLEAARQLTYLLSVDSGADVVNINI